MARTRRWLRALFWLTAALVGLLAAVLVVSQTPWAQDRLRRLAMRQAERVLEGQLIIGRLEGTLFTGVTLHDVAVIQDGTPVVSIERVAVSYGLREILSEGRVVRQLHVDRPVVHVVRTATGWNVARLLRPRPPSEPGRPRATFTLPDIVVTDGLVTIEEQGIPRTDALPRRVQHLQFSGSVASEPAQLRIDIDTLALRAGDPDLLLRSVAGAVVNTREGWHLQDLAIETGESALLVDGSITRETPADPFVYALQVRADRVSLPEIGRFVPQVAPFDLSPTFTADLRGPIDALAMTVDVATAAGSARGPLTLDATGPVRGLSGDLAIEDVNLEPFLQTPDAASRITGNARFDLRFPSATPGDPLDGTFTFRGPAAAAYGYEATDVGATGKIAGRRLHLDAEATAYGGRATTRGHLDLPRGPRQEVALSLAGRIDGVDLQALPDHLPVPPLETELAGTYEVVGPISRIRASATLEDSRVEGALIGEGTTGAVERVPGGLTFEATGTLAALDLQRLGRALDVAALTDERFRGEVTGAFSVRGAQQNGQPLTLATEGTLRDTTIFGGRLPQMDVQATLDGTSLAVQARGAVAGFDLPALTGIDALTGTLTGTVDTAVMLHDLDDVRIETIDVDGRFSLERPTLLDVPFTRVDADVRMDGGVVQVRSLTGTGEAFTLTGEGPLALGETGVSDFAYRLDADSLVAPAMVADLPLRGAAITEGRITGSREEFRVTGTFDGTDVAYGDIATAARASATYAVDLPDLETDRIAVSADVEGSGVDVRGLAFEEVRGRVGYEPDLLTYDLVAQDPPRTLHAEGTLAIGDGEQVVRLRALGLDLEAQHWALAPGAEAVMTITPEHLQVEPIRLVSGDQVIDVRGGVALEDAASHDLEVVAERIDVGDALALTGHSLDVDGTGRFEASVGGTGALPTATGTLQITEARFRDLAIEGVTATVEFDGRQARVDALLRQSPRAYLTAEGTVPRWLFETPDDPEATPPADAPLDLLVKSTAIDLQLVEAITDHVRDVSGQVQVDARVTSVGRTPVVDGVVSVGNGAFTVPYTGVTYRNLNASLLFEDDHLVIRQLSMETRDGRPLTVTGQLGLQQEEPKEMSLTIAGERFRVLNNELGQLEIDTALQVRGTLAAPSIEGDVTLTSGRLELDRILPQLAPGAYATEADYRGIPTRVDPDAPPVVPNILDDRPTRAFAIDARDDSMAAAMVGDVALNVRVRIPDNLLIRGRDIEVGRAGIGDVNMTMGGDFRVVKTPDDPVVLLGAVNTVRGTYAYQGRRFEIARDGQVLFRGDPSLNPDIDITAERIIQGVEARVRIHGTLDEPAVEFSSTPRLDEGDILALIVFNQPINQLGTGEQNTLVQRAGGVAAGLVVSPIAQALGDTLDLDLFDVETTDVRGRVNPAVVIGQQVSPDLFVKFRQQFGNQQVSQFLLEYRLADFLRLEGNFAEGEGLSRGQRSLTQRIERYGMDLVLYFAF